MKPDGRSSKAPQAEQGFAFWCVNENVTASIPHELTELGSDVSERMKALGWSLFGNKERLDGFGVVFAYQRRTASGELELKPSVSVIVGDGTKSYTRASIPTSAGSFWNFRSMGRLEIKIRVQPTSILVEGRDAVKNAGWTKLAEIKDDPAKFSAKTGAYVGFTSFVGPSPQGTVSSSDEIMIDDLILENHDERQLGEVPPVMNPSEKTNSETSEDLLKDVGFIGEENAAKELSLAVYKLIAENELPRKSLVSAVKNLGSRLDQLEMGVKKLKSELVERSGHDLDGDLKKMKEEILSISRKTSTGHQAKRGRLDNLQRDMSLNSRRTAEELQSKARAVKSSVTSSGNTVVILAVFGVLIVLLAGLFMSRKFRRWEKKHIL